MKNRYISSFSQSVILAIVASSGLHAEASLGDKKIASTYISNPFDNEENHRSLFFAKKSRGIRSPKADDVDSGASEVSTPPSEDTSSESAEGVMSGEVQSDAQTGQSSPVQSENGSSDHTGNGDSQQGSESGKNSDDTQPGIKEPGFDIDTEEHPLGITGDLLGEKITLEDLESGDGEVPGHTVSEKQPSDGSGSQKDSHDEQDKQSPEDSVGTDAADEENSHRPVVLDEPSCHKEEVLTTGGGSPTPPEDLGNFQHVSHEDTVYLIDGTLSWRDVDCAKEAVQSQKVQSVDNHDSNSDPNVLMSEDGQDETNDQLEKEKLLSDEKGNSDSEAGTENSEDSHLGTSLSSKGMDDVSEELAPKVESPKVESKEGESEDSVDQPNSSERSELMLEVEEAETCKDHGLAFCNTKPEELSEKATQPCGEKCPYNGLTFMGSKGSDGLIFDNLKAKKTGAAIYSDSDVVFKDLKGGLTFTGCESGESGGAVSAKNIAVINCNNITLTNNKTTLSPNGNGVQSNGLEAEALAEGTSSSSPKDDLGMGGGAFWAGDSSAGVKTMLSDEEVSKTGAIEFLGNTGSITINGNSSTVNGGALAAKDIKFDSNDANTTFSSNTAAFSGGAVSASGTVIFSENTGGISFSGNKACQKSVSGEQALMLSAESKSVTCQGGAVAAGSKVEFTGNKGSITFDSNFSGEGQETKEPKTESPILGNGGAIASNLCSFSGNTGGVSFSNNETSDCGGAIFCVSKTVPVVATHVMKAEQDSKTEGVSFTDNTGAVTFSGNKASKGSGGAIYCSLESASTSVSSNGGQQVVQGVVSFSNNSGGINFSNNSSTGSGGAIYCSSEAQPTQVTAVLGEEQSNQMGIVFAGNLGGVSFINNASSDKGGAIYCDSKTASAVDTASILVVKTSTGKAAVTPGDVVFDGNTGGITFSGNSVSISQPKAKTTGKSAENIGGGAIFGNTVTVSGSQGVCSFMNNTLSVTPSAETELLNADDGQGVLGGGAVFGTASTIFSNNQGGVVFSNNSVTQTSSKKTKAQDDSSSVLTASLGGGAIFTTEFSFCGNKGASIFSDNSVSNQTGEVQTLEKASSKTYSGGGAVLATQKVNLSGNENLTFSSNSVAGSDTVGGAILSSKVSITGNGSVTFDNNSSATKGGAIYVAKGGVAVTNNAGASFSNNHTSNSGGAIFLEATSTSNELELSQYALPEDDEPAEGKLLITNNTGAVVFSNNYTISTTPSQASSLEAHEMKVVLQSAQSSQENYGGGAAFLKDLDISGNGDVSFLYNRGDKGGAIHVVDGGTVSLSADNGDIVFKGNTELDGTSDCIFLAGTTSKITKLRAKEGHSIKFYDSIIFDNPTTSRDTQSVQREKNGETPSLAINSNDSSGNSLSINVKDSEQRDVVPNPYTGTVEFGGGVSKIPQKATLAAGGLVISGGEVWFEGLKQEEGSYIQLSAGTTFGQMKSSDASVVSSRSEVSSSVSIPANISSSDKVNNKFKVCASSESVSAMTLDSGSTAATLGEGLEITELRIDLGSFSGGSVPAPKVVIVPKGGKNGKREAPAEAPLNVVLVDSSGTAMENHALLSGNSNIPLIEFMQKGNGEELTPVTGKEEDGALGVKEVKFTLGEGLDSGQQYGNQGSWTATLSSDGAVVGQWHRTGYSLNPNKDGAVVVNGLWGQYTDIRGIKGQIFHNHITDQRMEGDFFTNVWGSGLGQFVNSATVGALDGFVHRTGGYVLGMDTEIIQDFMVGGSFAQTFGYTDSKLHSIRCSERGYIGSVYAGISHYGRGSGTWMFKGTVLYGNISNNMTTVYEGKGLGSAKGSWSDHSLLAAIRIDRKKFSNSRSFSSAMINAWAPFIEVEYGFIDQMPFLESGGDQVRDFEKGKLQNLAVPIGITFENYYSRGSRSESLSFSIAYSPDAYRRNPKGEATVVAAKYTWNTLGCKWPRHAVRCRLDNNTEWNESLGTYMSFEYEGRAHVASYNFSGGARLIF